MGQFLSKITAQYNPPRKWIMKEDLTYICTELTEDETQALIQIGVKSLVNVKNEKEIKVETGFETDLASVPRLCWNIIAPWDVARAAIIHDILYGALRQAFFDNSLDAKKINEMRLAADSVFREGMQAAEPKIPNWKSTPCFWSVRPFGRWAIRKKGVFDT